MNAHVKSRELDVFLGVYANPDAFIKWVFVHYPHLFVDFKGNPDARWDEDVMSTAISRAEEEKPAGTWVPHKIAVIKNYRAIAIERSMNVGLKEAKDAVEAYACEHRNEWPFCEWPASYIPQ